MSLLTLRNGQQFVCRDRNTAISQAVNNIDMYSETG